MIKPVVFAVVLGLVLASTNVYAAMPQIVEDGVLTAPTTPEKANDFQLIDDEDYPAANDDSTAQDNAPAAAADEPAAESQQAPANNDLQQTPAHLNLNHSKSDDTQQPDEDSDALNQTSQNEPRYYYD